MGTPTGLIWLRTGAGGGACECGDRPSGSIKFWEIFWFAEDLIRGWSQKKCTRWQHCVSNEAIFPAISAVVLENFWKLVQCNLSPEVCALGNDRALKWRLFVSRVP